MMTIVTRGMGDIEKARKPEGCWPVGERELTVSVGLKNASGVGGEGGTTSEGD